MITNTKYYISSQTVPYYNIAIEDYLLNKVEHGCCILYLWQNKHTVVIGKNQNSWAQCKVGLLREEEGSLARRLSGGGAVYHDLGNLNFTFLVHEEDYDVKKQLQVIVEACKSFGIRAEQTGRNDVVVNGRKFSGNAFYQTGSRCYHHGTIMVDVNMDYLSRYLNVSLKKLQSKGDDSVKSRVINLKSLNEEITIDGMKQALLKAFACVYGMTAVEMTEEDMDRTEINRLFGKFSSEEWIYGAALPFTASLEDRYTWGEVELQFQVKDNHVRKVCAYSDAMDVDLVPELEAVLAGTEFHKEKLLAACGRLETRDEMQLQMKEDILRLIEENL